MRPTGRLHLGNYVGALQNWLKLQDEYECFYFVADWHMLTTEYAQVGALQSNIREMVIDWLAVGLDPVKATFFVQSRLAEHAELYLLLSMITPVGWLERVPTYKEQLENIKDRDLHTYGFLGYPVLQSADILMYKAHYVPVGEDQVPHVELTREIARRFNLTYGKSERSLSPKLDGKTCSEVSIEGEAELVHRVLVAVDPVFPEPQALLTRAPRLRGTDGRKMSKSYDNAIYLSDSADTVAKKVAGMMTDPARKRRFDPGNPDVCPVFDFHKIFSPAEVVERVNRECRTAAIGCVECKQLMARRLNGFLDPIRGRRKRIESDPAQVEEILEAGTGRAQNVARATMAQVRSAMNTA